MQNDPGESRQIRVRQNRELQNPSGPGAQTDPRLHGPPIIVRWKRSHAETFLTNAFHKQQNL